MNDISRFTVEFRCEFLICFSLLRGMFFILTFSLYCCMAVATTVGTALAYLLVPMRSLGQDSWKIAAALMGRHIGGGYLLFTF